MQSVPFVLQMVSVPNVGNPTGGQLPQSYGMQSAEPRLSYPSDTIVLAAGQYREIRPMVHPGLLAAGGCRFHVEPAELPAGLQLDPLTGIIWGAPAPQTESGVDAKYQHFNVHLEGPLGGASTQIALKVVNFQPQDFQVSHVSQLDNNKYMVIVETSKPKK